MTGVIIGVTAVVTTVIVACCFLFGLLIGFWMCENEIRKELDSGKIPKVVEECMLTVNDKERFWYGERGVTFRKTTENPQSVPVDYKDFEAYERGEK